MGGRSVGACQETTVVWKAGDATVLCAIVRSGCRAVIVANTRYPDAQRHAEQHLTVSADAVWICDPDCPGS